LTELKQLGEIFLFSKLFKILLWTQSSSITTLGRCSSMIFLFYLRDLCLQTRFLMIRLIKLLLKRLSLILKFTKLIKLLLSRIFEIFELLILLGDLQFQNFVVISQIISLFFHFIDLDLELFLCVLHLLRLLMFIICLLNLLHVQTQSEIKALHI
jgi:hypothetical protein